jgi:hypothetical protein
MLPLLVLLGFLWVGSVLVILVLDFNRPDELPICWHVSAEQSPPVSILLPGPQADRKCDHA